MNVTKYRIVRGQDGEPTTEIWIDGQYSRIQAALSQQQAVEAVRHSRRTCIFRDRR